MAFDDEPFADETEPEEAPTDTEEDPAAALDLMADEPDAAEAEPPATDYASEQNIAKLLTHTFLTALASRVKTAADESYKTSAEWRQNTAENLRLYNGDIPDLGGDQKNITAVHLPYAKRAVRIFFSKLFPQLYPPTGDIVNLRVKSPALQEIADRCTIHMNFQLLNDIVEYIPSHDRGMKQLLIEGSIFETWRYDILQKRPVQEIHLAEDFWIPYTAKTDRPDLADVPIKTLVQPYQQHQLEELEAEGYYIGITKSFAHPDGGSTNAIYPEGASYDEAGTPIDVSGGGNLLSRDRPVKDVADANSGVEEPSNDPDGNRKFYEQDRMVKLPGEAAQRMVTICMDESSQQILRVSFCEMDDLKDKARHAAETQVWEQTVQSQMAMHEETIAQHRNAVEMTGHPDPMTGAPLPHPGEEPPPPQPPPPPAPVRKVPWHRHTKYDCDTNPEGALGHGIVDDVKGHNLLANKVSTRGVSLMTLNMLPTGIASRQSKFGRDETPMQLGRINEVQMSSAEVANGAGIKFVQFPPPDPNWYKVVELADQSAQEVTAFDIAAGAPGMSGETATESEMRHSNATDNISAIGQRVNRGRAWSLRNLAYINSLTLPDDGAIVYHDMGDGQGDVPIKVTRADYEAILGELEVTFTCDPSFESKPLKEKRAQKRMQALNAFINAPNAFGMPVVDPVTAIKLLRMAEVDYLKTVDAPTEWISLIRNSQIPQIPGINAPAQPPQPPEGGNPNGPGPQAQAPGPGGMARSGPPNSQPPARRQEGPPPAA